MTPAPAAVAKLIAALRELSPREWAELQAWLIQADREIEGVKAALRAFAAEELRAAVRDVPGYRERPATPAVPPPPSQPPPLADCEPAGRFEPKPSTRRPALHLARVLAEIGRPASIPELAGAVGKSTAWVYQLAHCSWFSRTYSRTGLGIGEKGHKLYDLTPAGRAAIAAPDPQEPAR